MTCGRVGSGLIPDFWGKPLWEEVLWPFLDAWDSVRLRTASSQGGTGRMASSSSSSFLKKERRVLRELVRSWQRFWKNIEILEVGQITPHEHVQNRTMEQTVDFVAPLVPSFPPLSSLSPPMPLGMEQTVDIPVLLVMKDIENIRALGEQVERERDSVVLSHHQHHSSLLLSHMQELEMWRILYNQLNNPNLDPKTQDLLVKNTKQIWSVSSQSVKSGKGRE